MEVKSRPSIRTLRFPEPPRKVEKKAAVAKKAPAKGKATAKAKGTKPPAKPPAKKAKPPPR